MKYPKEVVEAAAVVVGFLQPKAGPDTLLPIEFPAELVSEAAKLMHGPTPAALMALWNDARDERLAACSKLTTQRRRHAKARLREFPRYEDWQAFMQCINGNEWLLGVTPSAAYPTWKANFDWFIRPGSMVKFMEGGFKQFNAKAVTARDRYADDLERRNAAPKRRE